MRNSEAMPRLIASLILLVSLSMALPLGAFLMRLGRDPAVPVALWAFPIAIVGTGAILMWMLTRKEVPLQLYLVAVALWLVAAVYFLWTADLGKR